jgi:hypothetical protein
VTQTDYGEFVKEVRRLTTVFRVRTTPSEIEQMSGAYFSALQRFSLEQVINASDAWIAKESKFPKPADLAQRMPAAPITAYTLSGAEAAEWLQAERQRYEAPPCSCQSCVAAGVTDQPLRFVPNFDANDRDVRVLLGERTVTAGHWAHGVELQRWYAARAQCRAVFQTFAVKKRLKRQKVSFEDRLAELYKPRTTEPRA